MSIGENVTALAFPTRASRGEDRSMSPSLPTREFRLQVLLVEGNRDLAGFLATALRAIRIDVSCAETAAVAAVCLRTTKPDLVIANLSTVDESGWLMLSKWRLTAEDLPVWFYVPQASSRDRLWADFMHVEQLFEYGDNGRRLASAIVDRLTERLSESFSELRD